MIELDIKNGDINSIIDVDKDLDITVKPTGVIGGEVD